MLRRPLARLAALLAPLLLPALPAAAQEEPITIADDPFQITDPRAAPPGEATLAFIGSYDRARRGRLRNTLGAEMELAIGLVPRLELRFGQAGAYGNLDIRRKLGTVEFDEAGIAEDGNRALWGGTTRFGALYQLTDERGLLPAIGLLGQVWMLYGPDRPSYETETIALIGKTIRGGERPLTANLNLGWVARFDPQPTERPSRYLLNASIGQTVSRNTALVLTYAREQQERGERDFSLIQAGIRHRLSDNRTVLGLAVGAGIGRDSPAFQIAFAVQWRLGGG